MMAARAMGPGNSSTTAPSVDGEVTACESYLPMVKLMRKVLRCNGMERRIKVFNKRSDELKVGEDINSRADVLVSEILDSELLGEGLILTLQHAHDMLLVKNPKTVPYCATTYGQLVESRFLWKLHDLYNHEAKAIDGISLVPTGLETIISVKRQQHAIHCDAIRDMKPLSEPFKIFEFDFWKRPESYGETDVCIKAASDGRVNAVISWWVLQLDSEGTLFYSTAPKWVYSSPNTGQFHMTLPGARNWCDHWKQCVWFIPGKGMSVSSNGEVRLHCVHTDTSSSYDLKTESTRAEIGHFDKPAGDYELILSPERVAMYGDSEWRFMLLSAVKSALQEKVSPLCVVADDSFFLTILIAHLSRSAHVISLFPGLREKGIQYLKAVAYANGYTMDRIDVLWQRNKKLTMDDTNQKEVDLLVGEPFYFGNEAALPWQNLRFWKDRTKLDSVLSKDVLIIPCKGILMACAMSLPDLWRSRCCLNEIEGFDHSAVNKTLGAFGELTAVEAPCLPFHIWQCGEVKELSKMHSIMEFDFSKPISPCFGKSKVEFVESGTCHGFVLWIDWVMDAKNSVLLSTGPDNRYWKQGVKLLSSPVAVGVHSSERNCECCSSTLEASFDPSSGELTVKCDFS